MNSEQFNQSKGTALIMAVLIGGLISTIALSVSRLAVSEIQMSSGLSDSVIAYYTAEAGLEKDLLRWRWNRDVDETTPSKDSQINVTSIIKYKGAAVCEKRDYPGADNKCPELATLKKDDVREFDVKGITSSILLQGQKDNNCSDLKIEVIKIKNINNNVTWETELEDISAQRMPGRLFQLIISTTGVEKIRIKPWGCDIYFNLYPQNPNDKIDIGTTTIESTGSYGKAKRKLRAEIDRQSGTLLSVFDFVIFAGQEVKQ